MVGLVGLTAGPSEAARLVDCQRRDFVADVTPEEITEARALPESGGHPVEAGFENAELAAVVDGDRDLEVTGLDSPQPFSDGSYRIGDRPRCPARRWRDRREIRRPFLRAKNCEDGARHKRKGGA